MLLGRGPEMWNKLLKQKPQVNLARSTPLRMWLVCSCAGIAVLESSWTDRFVSLQLALVAMMAALGTEFWAQHFFRREGALPGGRVSDGSAAASAMVLSLLLPNHIHPLYAALGVVFAMLLVKFSFGGLGANWMNPALGAWLFIRFSWPRSFEAALEGSGFPALAEALRQGLSDPQGSPLGILRIKAGDLSISGIDLAVTGFLNRTAFSLTGSELPAGYVSLFFSPSPGIIADRGIAALFLGTAILLGSQVIRPWIPAVYLGTYALLVRVFGGIFYGGPLGSGDVLFGLFSGGTLAAAFFLVADPVSGAKSSPGMLAAVFLGAVFSFLFRYPGAEPYGAFFAVALVNVLTPLIRLLEDRLLYSGIPLARGSSARHKGASV
jgi:electron transport complex protein RnfD